MYRCIDCQGVYKCSRILMQYVTSQDNLQPHLFIHHLWGCVPISSMPNGTCMGTQSCGVLIALGFTPILHKEKIQLCCDKIALTNLDQSTYYWFWSCLSVNECTCSVERVSHLITIESNRSVSSLCYSAFKVFPVHLGPEHLSESCATRDHVTNALQGQRTTYSISMWLHEIGCTEIGFTFEYFLEESSNGVLLCLVLCCNAWSPWRCWVGIVAFLGLYLWVRRWLK